ncbi:hypothetical protein GIB67_033699 [Kingdonia uniflora]|uniref:SWIRM domain-containing protein n=1 Tax=Kingdonia uniflora TaxID=39325 RepID=A0A7J7P3Z0_9MAGN|nr:hypothetical protein GIB67_033699 [Kingdonia uniflora]
MATMEKSPIKPSPQNPSKPPSPSPSPNPNPNPPTSDPIEISTSEAPRVPPPEPPSSTVSEVITIPSYSRWFSLDEIHEVERRFLPEFFSLRSSSKNAGVYEYYRRTIVEMYRETSVKRKIAFTEARKVLVGDVGSIRRVFDFLEGWGLINYTPAVVKQPVVKPEEKENKVSSPNFECSKKTSTKKLCTGCRTLCSIACFVYDQVIFSLLLRPLMQLVLNYLLKHDIEHGKILY